MTKVLILSGGDSDEREVSLRSGAAVAAALRAKKYDVSMLDPSDQTPDYEQHIRPADVVFPVLHGLGGEDGTIQEWLEARGVCYVGADAASSRLCFDKWQYKQILIEAGLPVPRGALVTAQEFTDHELTTRPYVLKPNDGGSSVDTFIIRDVTAVDVDAVNEAFNRHPHMLLEELIPGTEITVGVLLDEALPVIEIVPPADGEFDYENKYNGKTQELCPPQSVAEPIQSTARDLALRIHRLLYVRDMSRTDIMVSSNGQLYVLETNTIPGMTDQSLLPKAAAAAGHSMPEVCGMMVEAALTRRR